MNTYVLNILRVSLSCLLLFEPHSNELFSVKAKLQTNRTLKKNTSKAPGHKFLFPKIIRKLNKRQLYKETIKEESPVFQEPPLLLSRQPTRIIGFFKESLSRLRTTLENVERLEELTENNLEDLLREEGGDYKFSIRSQFATLIKNVMNTVCGPKENPAPVIEEIVKENINMILSILIDKKPELQQDPVTLERFLKENLCVLKREVLSAIDEELVFFMNYPCYKSIEPFIKNLFIKPIEKLFLETYARLIKESFEAKAYLYL